MLVLTIDTAGVSRTTCALLTPDSWRGMTVMASPAESLAPAIESLLQQGGFTMRDITQIVCGIGPGPFTGLRIGLAHAQAAAHALGVPVAGVSSLAAVAHRIPSATRPEQYLVATDARRKEVYASTVLTGAASAGNSAATAAEDAATTHSLTLGAPQVIKPADLAAQHPPMLMVGDGADVYADVFTAAGHTIAAESALLSYEEALVNATHDALNAEPVPALPEYMREPDAVPAAGLS